MSRIEIGNDLTIGVPGFAGVEVTMRRAVGLRDFLLFQRLGALGGLEEESVDKFEAGVRDFGDRFLIDWNINLRGEELPATGESLLKLPITLQLGLLREWLTQVRGVGAPLDDESQSSSTSQEEPVATEAR